ncbi:MAG: AAA family ATPase, partial [Bacteroidota bacterium]
MLKKLLVRNYALIKELEIGFDKGLTIMTGETGAGKSIILGALSLILGNRADSSALLDKSSKCIVEGQFDLNGNVMTDFFIRNELDDMNPAVMRREISPNGRSRAFINDSPVTLDIMKEMGSRLIDIHSQHQSLLLGSNTFQLSVIDSFAGHNELLEEYRQMYREYTRLNGEYKMLAEKRERNISDLDYYSYQLKQLDQEKLVEGEEKELEAEQELLTHAGDINEALAGSSLILNGDDHSVINRLNEMRRLLERVADYYPDARELLQRLESVIIELNDIGNETEQRASAIDSDPGRLEQVTQR